MFTVLIESDLYVQKSNSHTDFIDEGAFKKKEITWQKWPQLENTYLKG